MLLPRSCCYHPRISSWFQLLNSGVGCHRCWNGTIGTIGTTVYYYLHKYNNKYF